MYLVSIPEEIPNNSLDRDVVTLLDMLGLVYPSNIDAYDDVIVDVGSDGAAAEDDG